MIAQNAYHTVLTGLPEGQEIAALAERVFPLVFRSDFDRPGFALLSLETEVTSHQLRQFMVRLKEALAEIYREGAGKSLAVFGMSRFDQQNTTKYHLDGGPEESYLLLGYEPSEVQSEVRIADCSKAAFDLGISPRQFLSDYNPMFAPGEKTLADYSSLIRGFDSRLA